MNDDTSNIAIQVDAAASAIMSDYERRRAENVERNNSRLYSLGLITLREMNISNDSAWKRKIGTKLGNITHEPLSDEETLAMDKSETEPRSLASRNDTGNRIKRVVADDTVKAERSSPRRSKRLRGEGATQARGQDDNDDSQIFALHLPTSATEREKHVRECREARLRVANEVALVNAGNNSSSSKNPTATYDHCLMRVRTMTEKGLRNRVKAIERAAGIHCVVKMAIFKSCLQDEGMWNLAQLASEALERLKMTLA